MAIIPKQILAGWETVFGETPATPTPFMLCAKENNITFKRETEEVSCMGGAIDSGGNKIDTGVEVGGSIVSSGYWEQLGVYFKATLGEPVTVDNADTTYTHTFDTTKETIPSMYIETISGADELVEVVNGAYGSKLGFSIVGKGLLDLTLDVMAQSHLDNLKDSYTKMDDSNKIALPSSEVKMSKSYLKLNGTDFCKFSEISFEFDRGAEVTDLLCSKKDIDITLSDLTGSIKAVWDTSFYQTVAQNTTTAIEAGFVDGTNKLAVIIPEMQFDFETAPKKVKEKVLIDTNYSATRSASGSFKAQIVLTNTIASY